LQRHATASADEGPGSKATVLPVQLGEKQSLYFIFGPRMLYLIQNDLMRFLSSIT